MTTRVNESRLEKRIATLRQHVPEWVHLTTQPYDFTEERPNYFTIMLDLFKELEYNLEDYVNERLDPAKTGARARWRFIGYSQLENGKVRYCAEVVPLENIEPGDYALVTEEFLQMFSPVFRNFWVDKYKHRKKNGKKR